MPKMRIFNRLEEIEFESPPKFNSAEGKQFLTVSKAIEDLLEKLGTPTNKVCFLVAIGYFKARRRFFARQFRQADIEFVAARMGINPLEIDLKTYSRETYARHQRFILEHFGYSSFNEVAKKFTVNEIKNLVRLQCRPKQILLNVIQSLVYRKFVLPSYNVLATLIIEEIQRYEHTLSTAVFNLLTEKQREKLDSFLEKTSDENHNSSYRLTFFKKTYQSTKPLKIKANLDDLKTLQPFYLEFQPVITQLNLSNASISHYAYLVINLKSRRFRGVQLKLVTCT